MQHYFFLSGFLLMAHTATAEVTCPDLSGTYAYTSASVSCSTSSYESDGQLPVPSASINPGLLGEGTQLVVTQSSCGEVVLTYEHFGKKRDVTLLSQTAAEVSEDVITEWVKEGLTVKAEEGGLGSGNYASASFQLRPTAARDLEIIHNRTDISPFFGLSREYYTCTLTRQ
ncbi:MAG TPA: hypothetical protein VE954_00270 [Oligoflexus sp.]|uniref:hypothetical protein n=1 Tax=Oligoflexus sp. TaxID=1971216 RepID=UPI002D62CE98|nr:hypothetical protein [Oligoflexus sp.]HYX31512.1 hypothetical protein [Oligoflexus sp.]